MSAVTDVTRTKRCGLTVTIRAKKTYVCRTVIRTIAVNMFDLQGKWLISPFIKPAFETLISISTLDKASNCLWIELSLQSIEPILIQVLMLKRLLTGIRAVIPVAGTGI